MAAVAAVAAACLTISQFLAAFYGRYTFSGQPRAAQAVLNKGLLSVSVVTSRFATVTWGFAIMTNMSLNQVMSDDCAQLLTEMGSEPRQTGLSHGPQKLCKQNLKEHEP